MKDSNDFHRSDDADLIACASSRIIYCHRSVERYEASITACRELSHHASAFELTMSYDVTTMWNEVSSL